MSNEVERKWISEGTQPLWKDAGWQIFRRNRTSGKSRGGLFAKGLGEYAAKTMANDANRGAGCFAYKVVSPDGEIFHLEPPLARLELELAQLKDKFNSICADNLKWENENVRLSQELAAQTNRVMELTELLRSAHCIAERNGTGTAWERFRESCKKLGVGSVTARTYRILPSDQEETSTTDVQTPG